MSVSMRSTKAQMYSEIERLRALLDQRDLQIEELSASRFTPQPSAAPLSERGTQYLMMKRLAIVCKASVKWVDGQGFRQYKDGSWVAIPTHTIEFIAKGIGQ